MNKNLTLKEVLQIYHDNKQVKNNNLYYLLAKRALELGENFYAYDIVENISEDNLSIKIKKIHIMALSLARSGAINHAVQLVNEIPDIKNSELIGLKSRILKDLAIKSKNPAEKKSLYKMAGNLSLNIFNIEKKYYNGINAASCLFCAGEKEFALNLVKNEILPLCLREKYEDDLWLLATLGEAHLLIEDYNNSLAYYKKAAQIVIEKGQMGSFSSTLKQIFMLSNYLDKSMAQMIIKNLNLPSVAVFIGCTQEEFLSDLHIIQNEELIRQNIALLIKKYNIQMSFSSLFCPVDVIFIEEMLKAGGGCHILPPIPLKTAVKKYVKPYVAGNFEERFARILKNNKTFFFDAECDEIQDKNDEVIYEFVNKFIYGLAFNKANSVYFPFVSIKKNNFNTDKIFTTEYING